MKKYKIYKTVLFISLLLSVWGLWLALKDVNAIGRGIGSMLADSGSLLEVLPEAIPVLLEGMAGALPVVVLLYLLANYKKAPEPKFCRILLWTATIVQIFYLYMIPRYFITDFTSFDNFDSLMMNSLIQNVGIVLTMIFLIWASFGMPKEQEITGCSETEELK